MPFTANRASPPSFALSLSKGRFSAACKKGRGFDKLSPNGFRGNT